MMQSPREDGGVVVVVGGGGLGWSPREHSLLGWGWNMKLICSFVSAYSCS